MKIHLIAIGGSIMHNLAIALHKKGFTVTGSDDMIFEPASSRLQKYGLLPAPGWNADNIKPDLDFVIVGMHAKEDNPELKSAKELRKTIVSFPEFLYEQSKDKTRVVIAGSHGKTTVTSMVMYALRNGGVEFDYAVGSSVQGFEDSVSLSENAPIMIIEGDEYLTSPLDRRPKFMWYHPQIALINGIAWDHINVFPTYEIYLEQFSNFIRQLERGTRLLYHEGDEETERLVKEYGEHTQVIKVGLPGHRTEDGQMQVMNNGKWYPISVFGRHNLQNLAAAQQICALLGMQEEDFWKLAEGFRGAGKRLEPVSNSKGIAVFRDFAHAPSKVKASVDAVRSHYPDKKLFAVLELHTFSSLDPEFIKGYAGSLAPADTAMVYLDKEILQKKGNTTYTEEEIRKAFARNDIMLVESPDILREMVIAHLDPAHAVLLMSSGNLGGLKVDELLTLLSN